MLEHLAFAAQASRQSLDPGADSRWRCYLGDHLPVRMVEQVSPQPSMVTLESSNCDVPNAAIPCVASQPVASTSDTAPIPRSVSDMTHASPTDSRLLEARLRSAGSVEQMRQAGLRLQKSSLVVQLLLGHDLVTPHDASESGNAHLPLASMVVCGVRAVPSRIHGTPHQY